MSHLVNPGAERPGRTAPGSQIKGTVILFKTVDHLDARRKADRQIPNAVFESLGGTAWQTALNLSQTITYGSGTWQRHSPRVMGAEYSCLSWTQSRIWPLCSVIGHKWGLYLFFNLNWVIKTPGILWLSVLDSYGVSYLKFLFKFFLRMSESFSFYCTYC